MNIRVIIGTRGEQVNLAHEFFPRIFDPAIMVGIGPYPHLWDGMSRLARRISHPRYDLWVRIAHKADWGQQLSPEEILRVREDPASRSGDRSAALYLFEGEFIDHGIKRAILGQFLPARGMTSCHYHQHTVERFIPVIGTVDCWRQSVGWHELAGPLTIEKRETHCLHACTDSFVVIIMDGPYGLTHADHHYDDAPILRQY